LARNLKSYKKSTSLINPKAAVEKTLETINLTMGMDLSGFHHHKRLTTMVRRDGDLGGRRGRLPRMSKKLFPLSEKGSISILCIKWLEKDFHTTPL